MDSSMSSRVPSLSPRLASLLELSREGGEAEVFWDIACDHGHMGLWAGQSLPALKEVCWVDPSEAVFDKLVLSLDAHIPKPIFKKTLLRKKGEELTVIPGKHLFVMAGIGGKTAWDILRHLRPQAGPEARFVVSVNRDILQLRQHLKREGWGLINEVLVRDQSYYYQQLLLASSGPAVSPYGEKFWQTELGKEYREHQLGALRPHRDQLSQGFVSFLEGLAV